MDDIKDYVESLDEATLRNTLSKYMEDVPPITVTTRPLLESQLRKFLKESTINDDPNQNILNTENDKDITTNDSLIQEHDTSEDPVDAKVNDEIDELIQHEELEDLFEKQPEDEPVSRNFNRKSLLSDEERKRLLSELPSYKRQPLHSNLEEIKFSSVQQLSFKYDEIKGNRSPKPKSYGSNSSKWKRNAIIFLLLSVFIVMWLCLSSDIYYKNPITTDI